LYNNVKAETAIFKTRSKTSLLEQPLQKWSPAKYLFVTQSSQPKSDLSALNLDWLSSAVIQRQGAVQKLTAVICMCAVIFPASP